MPFFSTKFYGQSEGISCAFRQWRANHSHCQLLHGYALGFKFTFACDKLDERGWCMDFGGLKALKQKLKDVFDHKVALAKDDPLLPMFLELQNAGGCEVMQFVGGVGIEKFAKQAWHIAAILLATDYKDDVMQRGLRVYSVECSEHEGNSAIYQP